MITNIITRQIIIFFLAITASWNALAQTAPAQALEPAQLQEVATLLTGREPAAGLPIAIRDNLKWKIYTKEVENNWAEYTKKIGDPMVSWAKEHLSMTTNTIFYPFSGPDFTTVYRLFPQAKRYVMVAMQHAGRPMDLGHHSPLITDQSLEQLTSAWQLYGTHGFLSPNTWSAITTPARGKLERAPFSRSF